MRIYFNFIYRLEPFSISDKEKRELSGTPLLDFLSKYVQKATSVPEKEKEKYSKFITEEEVNQGILQNGKCENQAWVVNRIITDLDKEDPKKHEGMDRWINILSTKTNFGKWEANITILFHMYILT